MTDYEKALLSASTSGKGVLVVGTATGSATLIHTAVAGSVNFDEIYIYATNNHTADVVLTIEFGSADVKDNIVSTIPTKKGNLWIIPGQLLQGGLTVKAFAVTANVVTLHGWVNTMRAS